MPNKTNYYFNSSKKNAPILGKYRCDLCEFETKTFIASKLHFKVAHKNIKMGPMKFVCKKCKYCVDTKKELVMHMDSHVVNFRRGAINKKIEK